jgi:hypothetical protein
MPSRVVLLVAFAAALTLALGAVQTRADGADMPMHDLPWNDIGALAKRFVDQESPDNVWPFQRASRKALAASTRKVVVHYMPSMPISHDNKPIEADTWALELLRRSGQGGKFANVGGFARQRPLPAGPWSSPYWREINATIDVLRARLMGADGFLVDILRDPKIESGPLWDQTRRICAAASALTLDFHFIPGIDSVALAALSVDEIAKISADLMTCPAIYRLTDERVLYVPYAPSTQTPDFWRQVLAKLAAQNIRIAFVPDLLDPGRFAAAFAPISAGFAIWGPRDLSTLQSEGERRVQQHAASLVKYWMQPIAAQDARPRQSILWETSNTALLRGYWERAIRDQPPFVQLITWNDYPEGTEFSPSSGSQFLFYDLSAYYIEWYKSGRPPPITRDAIYYSHRTQIFDPGRILIVGDRPFQLKGATELRNNVEMVALLTAPARLQIELGGRKTERDVGAGLQVLTMSASPGRPVFRIVRNGTIAVEKVSDWTIDGHPSVANPDYFGGSSTRAFRPVPGPH